MHVNKLFGRQTQIRTKFRTQNVNFCGEMGKLGTQCSAFGCSKRKKVWRIKENFVEVKVKEVQMTNLDRNESFLGHFIRKCRDKICQLCKATFSSFYNILQLNFTILLNLPGMFFQVVVNDFFCWKFSKFSLKGYTSTWQELYK